MTQDELNILRSMSRDEIALRYGKRLARREITLQQYEKLLSLSEKKIEGAEAIAEAFGGAVSGMHDARSIQNDAQIKRGVDDELARSVENSVVKTQSHIESTQAPIKPKESVTGASQKARLLAYLLDKAWHTTPDIMVNVYGVDHQGTCRISERIRELKAEGYQIESRKDSKTIWAYRLV